MRKSKPTGVAVAHYETKCGTDTLIALTVHTDVENLPSLTNILLAELGVMTPK